MDTQRIDAFELTTYWNGIAGGAQEVIPYWHLPPWDEICSKLSWSTHLLDRGYFSKKRFGYSGVYRLIALEKETETEAPATLNRVLRQDSTGTLYIGCAWRLNERVNEMRRRRSTHNAISALKRTSLVKLFPLNKLAVAFMRTDRGMIEWAEQDLLSAYMNSFGDTPPLNYLVRR